MKRKTVHSERLRLRQAHPDVIAAWSMGLVTRRDQSYVHDPEFFIGDRDVSTIIRDLFKYNAMWRGPHDEA